MNPLPGQESVLPPLKVEGGMQTQHEKLPSNAVIGLNAEMLKQFNIENKRKLLFISAFQTQDKI